MSSTDMHLARTLVLAEGFLNDSDARIRSECPLQDLHAARLRLNGDNGGAQSEKQLHTVTYIRPDVKTYIAIADETAVECIHLLILSRPTSCRPDQQFLGVNLIQWSPFEHLFEQR